MPAFRHWIAPRSALLAFLTTGLGGAALVSALAGTTDGPFEWSVSIIVVFGMAVGAGLLTGWLVERQVGRRVRVLSSFLTRSQDDKIELERLPPLGDDEVGLAAAGVNQLLADMTTVRGDMIDQRRELADIQEQLRLKEALAKKSDELEARLRERAILFDILRASASKIGLEAVLSTLVERLASALRLREVAILIREDEQFVIRGAQGFMRPEAVLGRGIGPGEGVAGVVATSRDPVVVSNVCDEPRYLAFWGEVPREGSFAAVPIHHGGELLGILVLTRSPDDPLLPVEVRFLGAIGDQMAMSIRHAQLVDELQDLSTHDELTKLANRRLLQSRLTMEFERARRFEVPLSVLAIDIDYFKQLNDRAGHAAGDEALKQVAGILAGNVRSVDTVSRVGGEEFVVLLPRTDMVEATAVGEKLRRRLEETPLSVGDLKETLTISVGVATLRSDEEQHTMLARADQALYLAKKRGRNRTAVQAEERPAVKTLH